MSDNFWDRIKHNVGQVPDKVMAAKAAELLAHWIRTESAGRDDEPFVPITPTHLLAWLTQKPAQDMVDAITSTITETERLQAQQMAGRRILQWGRDEYYLVLKAPPMQAEDLQYHTLVLGRQCFDEFCVVMDGFKTWLLS